jgi:Fe(3+) dicitrate transport protein
MRTIRIIIDIQYARWNNRPRGARVDSDIGLPCKNREVKLMGCSLHKPARGGILLVAAGLSTSFAVPAQDSRPVLMERIVVVGDAGQRHEIGGSVQFLDAELLDTWSYSDVNRILRQTPGIYLQEEDGYGLRPNIGIRGSGTDRSSRVAIIEDGVLIAPAPYAAPAAYYFPFLGRMHAVEVVKGPASIKYGPQTVGGAINFYSTPIPGVPGTGAGGKLDLFGGDYGTRRAHGVVGGWLEIEGNHDVGLMFEIFQDATTGFKRLDSAGDTGYRVEDYVAKIAIESRPGARVDQSLELKFQSSTERSDETYLGLTLADFRADPYRRYNGSQVDIMDVDHQTLQATHRIDLGAGFDLTTLVYRTDTTRAWYKLNDIRNAADTGFVGIGTILDDPATYATEYAALIGAPGDTSAAGALRVRNNNREYYANGIQTVLGKSFATGGARHQLEASVRWHRDEEDRFQHDDRYTMVNGTMVLETSGSPGSQDNRVGAAEAWSFFVRDTIAWGDWTIAPGLRYERIDLTRTDYSTADPTRSGGPTRILENDIDIWIPGLSVTWWLDPAVQLLAGAHRGFSNPGPGSTADAETSWNYEAGVRYIRGLLALEAIGFYSDYSNLVGTCTASTGGGCDIGDQFDGGAVEVSGLELMAHYDASRMLGLGRIGVPLAAIYTYTRTEFGTSFTTTFAPWGTVNAGDELPYVPAHQLTLNAGLTAPRWRTHLSMNYVDVARARAGSGSIPAEQRIDRRVLFDLAAEVDVAGQTAVFVGVENMTDEVYNVAFSPAGARPGKPRTYLVGFKSTF